MTKEEQQQFIEKLNKLQEEYKVKLTVILAPANWFARIFRRFIKINWSVIFIDKE